MLIHTCVVKLLELVLSTACVVLHQYSYDLTDVPTFILCSGTYVGYVIILTGEIIGELASGAADPYIKVWWSVIGGFMFAISGALTLRWWQGVVYCDRRTLGNITAVVAIVTAGLFVIDALVSLCHSKYNGETKSKSKM